MTIEHAYSFDKIPTSRLLELLIISDQEGMRVGLNSFDTTPREPGHMSLLSDFWRSSLLKEIEHRHRIPIQHPIPLREAP